MGLCENMKVNDFLIKISETSIKSEDIKDIRQLKKDSDELEDIEKLVYKFNKLLIKPIKSNTNKDFSYLQDINLVDKKKLIPKLKN